MSLVAFEIAGQVWRDLANKISGNFDDLRRFRTDRVGYLRVNLIPGEDLVAGNVEGLAKGFFIADQARKPDSKIAGGCEGPRSFTIIMNKYRFAVFETERKRVAGTGNRIWHPSVGVGVGWTNYSHRKAGLVRALLEPILTRNFFLCVIPPAIFKRRVLRYRDFARWLFINGSRTDEDVLANGAVEEREICFDIGYFVTQKIDDNIGLCAFQS